MKQTTKLFFRSFRISSLIAFCLFLGVFGIFEAYTSIRQIGFGEYRSAIEIEEGTVKILDFEIEIK